MENYASLLSTLRRIYLNVYLLCKFHQSIKRHLKVCRHLIITHSKLAQLRSVSVPARWLQWKPRHSTHVHTHNHTHVHTHNHTHAELPRSGGSDAGGLGGRSWRLGVRCWRLNTRSSIYIKFHQYNQANQHDTTYRHYIVYLNNFRTLMFR